MTYIRVLCAELKLALYENKISLGAAFVPWQNRTPFLGEHLSQLVCQIIHHLRHLENAANENHLRYFFISASIDCF